MGEEAQDVDLTTEERAEIDGMFLRLANADYYELLGVAPDADRRAIRDAYFKLSQRFHPDAWFGRRTGVWKSRMEAIFRDVTKAYDVLSNRNHRSAYDASLGLTTGVGAQSDAVRAAAKATPVAPPSTPPARTSNATMAAVSPPPAPAAPTITAPPVRDPNAPIIPDRSARPVAAAPPPPTVAAPQIDHEAAKRAAREALARKMGGNAVTTGRYPAIGRPTTGPVPTGQSPIAKTSGTTISTSTLASLQNARAARLDAERTAKLEHFLRLADESVGKKDPLGEANALQLALTIVPDDAALKTRADDASRRAAEVMAEKYIEHARQAESQHRFDVAAEYWQRAAVGRPRDAGILLKAAAAVFRVGKELPKAADLAKRAVQVQPRVDAYALLADIYIAAGMRASAQVAADAAAKLDPNSPVVKDLLARARA